MIGKRVLAQWPWARRGYLHAGLKGHEHFIPVQDVPHPGAAAQEAQDGLAHALAWARDHDRFRF